MLEKYAQVETNDKKLYILAFPTNDFHQEPGSNEEIKEKVLKLLGKEAFYNPYFVLFEQSSLKDNPVYQLLSESMPDKVVRHNFFKYLIGKDGVPVSFHSKKKTLKSMEEEVQMILEK